MEQVIPLPMPYRSIPGLSNGRLGMLLLVGTETVLFSSFIGAYLVFRMAAPIWPPMGVPHLTVGLSAVNTGFLMVSSVLALGMRSAASANAWPRVFQRLLATAALGLLFIILQAIEFSHWYGKGLTLQTGPYGALFYSLIGCHALHVLGGLAILMVVLYKVIRGGRDGTAREWVAHAELYWHFVTAVWLVLFGLLYLS